MSVVYDNNIRCVWVRLISLCCKMNNFSVPSQAYNGWARSRVWPDIRWATCKIRAKNVVPRGLLLSESFIFPRRIVYLWQCCEVATFCDRAEVYLWCHKSVIWPDLKIEKDSLCRTWMGASLAKFQLCIASGSGTITRKPSGWWWPWPARV